MRGERKMTNKLGHLKEESIAKKFHEYLSQLPEVSSKDALLKKPSGKR